METAHIDLEAGTITLSLADFARLTGTDTLVLGSFAPPAIMQPRLCWIYQITSHTSLYAMHECQLRQDGPLRWWICSCADWRYRSHVDPETGAVTIGHERYDCKHIPEARHLHEVLTATAKSW